MPQYERKPKTIEAYRFGYDEPPQWMREAEAAGTVIVEGASILLTTVNMVYRGQLGDAIVLVRPGKLDVIPEAEFVANYRLVFGQPSPPVDPGEYPSG